MLKIEVSGHSHDPWIGAVCYGLPAGEKVDFEELSSFMARRRPATRKENDEVEFLSGIAGGETDGAPLIVRIRNEDVKPEDYEAIRDIPRPGHADFPAYVRSQGEEDLRGGGKFSGRLTAPVCAVGGIALQICRRRGIEIAAFVKSLGGCEKKEEWDDLLKQAKARGDSLGGIVQCEVTNLPVGAGDSLFEGLDGAIAYGVFAIPGCKGIGFGEGFHSAELTGSEMNDGYRMENGAVRILSNHAGGILGGMSTGAPVVFESAFKPTPSIAKEQSSVNLKTGESVSLQISGRHDTAFVLRVPPIVEAVTALAVLNALDRRAQDGPLARRRAEIDALDQEIARLLQKRFALTDSLGPLKKQIRDGQREAAVLHHVQKVAGGELSEDIRAIYETILSISRKRQEEAAWRNTD